MAKQKIFNKTPASLGYSFPPEWHPHAGTWFSWPRPEGISFPGKYHTVPENLAAIIKQIVPREKVHINVPNDNWEFLVRQQFKQFKCPDRNVFFHYIKTNESWCRDHGPAFVLRRGKRRGARGEGAIVDWGFNAWGGKYPPYDDDDRVPTEIAQEMGLPVFYPALGGVVGGVGASPTFDKNKRGRGAHATAIAPVIMEGGSVEFNGRGTVMTTEQCLLNKNRNPKLSKKQIEGYLKDYYGQKHVAWLGEGIVGDDTDGHIDDLARFIDPNTVVVGVEPDKKDANYEILMENRRRAGELKDQDGKPFRVVEVPMPGVVEHDGQRLPATYLNFYFINNALLVPIYRHRKNDRLALQILQKHLPRHKVIGIDCVELIWGLGSIHCLTQQQPKF